MLNLKFYFRYCLGGNFETIIRKKAYVVFQVLFLCLMSFNMLGQNVKNCGVYMIQGHGLCFLTLYEPTIDCQFNYIEYHSGGRNDHIGRFYSGLIPFGKRALVLVEINIYEDAEYYLSPELHKLYEHNPDSLVYYHCFHKKNEDTFLKRKPGSVYLKGSSQGGRGFDNGFKACYSDLINFEQPLKYIYDSLSKSDAKVVHPDSISLKGDILFEYWSDHNNYIYELTNNSDNDLYIDSAYTSDNSISVAQFWDNRKGNFVNIRIKQHSSIIINIAPIVGYQNPNSTQYLIIKSRNNKKPLLVKIP